MSFRMTAIGLVAASALCTFASADELEATPDKPEAPVAASEAAPADQPAADATEAAVKDPKEMSVEEAAAAVVDDPQAKPQKTINPNKATQKQIDEYNKTAAPDLQITCRKEHETGSSFRVRQCRTAAQWREIDKLEHR
jgi:hypothetical protein